MNIQDYIQALRKWFWLIAICAICAAAAGLLFSIVSPPIYRASVLIMSNQTANSGIVDYNSLLGGQRVIETYRILLTTEPVLEEVITNLDLPYSIRELAKHIEVHSIPDTQLLELIVEDTDPDRAAETANEVAFTFLLHQSSEKQLQFIEAQEQTILEQMDALEQSIEQNSAELEKARGSASLFTQEELAALETRQLEQRGTYAQLISSYLDIQSMQSRLLDIAVVEPALPPRQSVRPRTLLNSAIILRHQTMYVTGSACQTWEQYPLSSSGRTSGGMVFTCKKTGAAQRPFVYCERTSSSQTSIAHSK